MEIWVGGPQDVREGHAAAEALKTTNDSAYLESDGGVRMVPVERWNAAQKFEGDLWMDVLPYAASDRNHEHRVEFGEYAALPAHLGQVLEVGCGPFTQAITVLQDRQAAGVTLLDPLMHRYVQHPNCNYARGNLAGVPAQLLSRKLEDLPTATYDCTICINVLEHVQDVRRCLSNILDSVKAGGYLVFHERTWDRFDPTVLYDVGHPIRITSADVDALFSNFTTSYHKYSPYECGTIHYFIGRKS